MSCRAFGSELLKVRQQQIVLRAASNARRATRSSPGRLTTRTGARRLAQQRLESLDPLAVRQEQIRHDCRERVAFGRCQTAQRITASAHPFHGEATAAGLIERSIDRPDGAGVRQDQQSAAGQSALLRALRRRAGSRSLAQRSVRGRTVRASTRRRRARQAPPRDGRCWPRPHRRSSRPLRAAGSALPGRARPAGPPCGRRQPQRRQLQPTRPPCLSVRITSPGFRGGPFAGPSFSTEPTERARSAYFQPERLGQRLVDVLDPDASARGPPCPWRDELLLPPSSPRGWGIAKERTQCAAGLRGRDWEWLMTTEPRVSNNGPPELPGFTATSV